MKTPFRIFFLLLICAASAHGELRLSAVFGDHMVLQQKMPIRVWGWTTPEQAVTVTLANESVDTTADADGRFELSLPAMDAGGPHTLTIQADDTATFSDVLIGEVWLCSGQSNMQWGVNASRDADLEKLSANFPNLRLISVPQVGTQEPQASFQGSWQPCSPETVAQFSGVGYFFGRRIHQALDVPVGLIDNAWGGSACEAWIRRDLLEDDPQYEPLMSHWKEVEGTYDADEEERLYQEALKAWEASQEGNKPHRKRNPLTGQHRPANLYNGVLKPVLGYSIRGTIWYQGESNSRRAYQYRELFPLMIQNWRDEWQQGDFPFYWVQLADFLAETPKPQDSAWAELREAQSMTMARLPNTGQAVIIDAGEAKDIHPRDKQTVGNRLARWALAKDYGFDINYRSPEFERVEFEDQRAIVHFQNVGNRLRTFDVANVLGFAIAGEDKVFHNAEAKLVDEDTIEVWHPDVSSPTAVRYAWADNPVCNVTSSDGLPLTPFRSDQWPGVTENVAK